MSVLQFKETALDKIYSMLVTLIYGLKVLARISGILTALRPYNACLTWQDADGPPL